MLFVEVVLKNMLRRKLRSALTAIGLAVAVAAMTSLLSIAWDFAGSASRYYESRNIDIVVVRAGVAERINSSLRQSLAGRLAALPAVAAVDYKLTEMVSLGEANLIGIPLHGVEPAGFTAANVSIESGRGLEPGDDRASLLGAGLAKSLSKAVGETIEIEGKPFRVLGVFQGVDALDSNTILAPLASVQQLMDRPGQVSEFQIRAAASANSDAELERLCREIEAMRDEENRSLGLKAMRTGQFVNSDTEIRLAGAMAYGTSAVAVILSAVGMLNTMLMCVAERTRELGVLRAIGWPRRRIMRLIIGEALVLSVSSAVIGCLLAWALIWRLSEWPMTRTLVQPGLSLAAAGAGTMIAMVSALLGGLYPAWRAASVPAVEALRYE